MNRSLGRADSTNTVQLSACVCVGTLPQQRIAVVGSDNIDVGNTTPTRKSGQPVVENLSGSNGSEQRIDPSLKAERQGKTSEGKTSKHPVSPCGAMTLHRGVGGPPGHDRHRGRRVFG